MSIKVIVPYDPVWEPLAWAKFHCPSYITNEGPVDLFKIPGEYNIAYYFGDERDATLFALRWS
jgi:hypothetical protein